MISVNTAKTTMAAIINACARVCECVCVCANQVVDSNGKSYAGQRTKIRFFRGLTSILVCQSNEMKNIWSKTLYVYVCICVCFCTCIFCCNLLLSMSCSTQTHTQTDNGLLADLWLKHYDFRVFSFAFKHFSFVLDFKIYMCMCMCM